MVTTPQASAAPDAPQVVIEHAVRSAIAGHPQGAVRRIVLYVILGACVGLAYPPAALVGIAVLLLLAATDQLL